MLRYRNKVRSVHSQCLITVQRPRLGQYNRERQRHTEFRIRMAHTIRLCSRHGGDDVTIIKRNLTVQ